MSLIGCGSSRRGSCSAKPDICCSWRAHLPRVHFWGVRDHPHGCPGWLQRLMRGYLISFRGLCLWYLTGTLSSWVSWQVARRIGQLQSALSLPACAKPSRAALAVGTHEALVSCF